MNRPMSDRVTAEQISALHSLADRACLMSAAAILIVSILAQGGRVSEKLDLLTHFAPLWLVGAMLLSLYGLLIALPTSKPWISASALIASAAAFALMAPEYSRAMPILAGSHSNQVKLIQLNAWKENIDVKGTVDWLVREHPDFITMDEIRPPIVTALIHQGFHFKAGIAHTAIFSRHTAVPPTVMIPMLEWPKLPGFARADFEVQFPDRGPIKINVFAVHLPWPTDPEERLEREALLRLVHLYPSDDVLLAGDFNLTPWSFGLQDLDQRIGLTRRDKALFSWPGRFDPQYIKNIPFPALPIDHVYAGSNWKTVSIRRGPRVGSDHYPVIVVLEYRPSAVPT